MLSGWLEEKSDFVPGLFPDVSLSGDWQFIAHYSQMLWPGTTDLGCGVASGSGFDWLVCPYYDPGGNKDGQLVGVSIAGAQLAASPAPVKVPFDRDVDRITPQGGAARRRGGRIQADRAGTWHFRECRRCPERRGCCSTAWPTSRIT